VTPPPPPPAFPPPERMPIVFNLIVFISYALKVTTARVGADPVST
jgi:hypothetical protein